MKRLSILAVFMLISVITFAQQALWGSQNIISPEIHPDNTVTFRFMAPQSDQGAGNRRFPSHTEDGDSVRFSGCTRYR